MKKYYITLSFLVACQIGIAQNKATKKADKYFARYEFVEAAQEYEKLVNNGKGDTYVYKQLADSYYQVFNATEASKWFAKAAEQDQEAEFYYKYAQMLKAQGKYDEANVQMKKFAQKAPADQRAITFNREPNYIPRLNAQQKLFNVKSVNFNSAQSDFGAFLTNDNTLYFASARNTSRKNYGWTEEPFLDIYQVTRNTDGTFSEATATNGVNSKWHDGPVSITADGNTMYFASETFREGSFLKDKSSKTKYGNVGIYKATKKDGKWTNVQALPFNSKEYSVSNPSISADGKTLYFASNMPGSMNESLDIWKVAVQGENAYGEPVNLGPNVNTAGRESFPFATEDGRLYFASDARPGFGGLDVFVADLLAGTEATNVGKPVNTEKDDFAFMFNATHNVGFFASNKSGNDEIYAADPVCGLQVNALVKNAKTGEIIPGASVVILDSKNNVIETKYTPADGFVGYAVDCETPYAIEVKKDGFNTAVYKVPAATKSGEYRVDALLEPIVVTPEEIVLNEIYFEFDKHNITREGAQELDKLVSIMKENPEMVIFVKAHTDYKGTDKYNLRLSERRAKATVQYVISQGIAKDRISGKGYGESEPKVNCGEDCTPEQMSENRRSEFIIVKK
jgi:outer membrane protein OmpA-like peptidoglycan-associated protein